MNAVQSAISHWEYIAPVLAAPNTEKDYDTLLKDLDSVLDAGGAYENHPLAELADRMADLVAAYEDQHYPMPQTTGVDALKFLMEERSLKQSDLPEVGSQRVVSEVLSGKRSLNVDQIRQLSVCFQVSGAVFL